MIGLALAVGLPNAWSVVLDPPTMRCATVNVSGDVTVTWTIPPDPGMDFLSYDLWFANDAAGPFSLLTTIFAAGTLSYTHLGAGGNAGPVFYYMTTTSTGPPPNLSVPSDTIATIFLQVSQSTPLGSANLSWDAPAIPPTAANDLTIWLEYPIGTWSLIATVPTSTSSYLWPVDICEDSLTFRIGLAGGAIGCVSFSNRDGAIFNDVTPPSVPVILSVSVDSITGLSTVEWDASPEPDTDGYIVVWNGPGGGVIIGTPVGQNNTVFPWLDSDASNRVESFSIAAFDSCETGTPPSPNISATGLGHATMLANVDYDRCQGQVRVFWTPYVGWTTQSHQVLVQVDGGAWSVLANTAGTVQQAFHSTQPGRTYCYIVKAVQANGSASSLSNSTCLFTSYPSQPQFNYLRTVTVTGPSTILVVDSVDLFAQVSSYRIERSANGGAYETVATIPGTAGPVIQWTDGDVRPGDSGYLYRVQVQDSCGNPSVASNIGGNIVLRATASLSGENLLEWNGYIQWDGSVTSYSIYRSIDDGAFELIDIVPPDPWTYTDNVNAFVGSGGQFCYYVVAQEAGNPSGIDAASVSNVVCAAQQELVYIPNGFIIGDGIPERAVFKPVIGFVDVDDYLLLVINRWGQVIWETDDPDDAWNGEVSGKDCPMGVYGYYCAVRSGSGKRVEKRGTVTLLRTEE